MFDQQFEELDWIHVYRTVDEEVLWLFQLWACKQVMEIAATNEITSKRDQDHCSKCTWCTVLVETTDHMHRCQGEGRVKAFRLGQSALERWVETSDTDLDLADCVSEYIGNRGKKSMGRVCLGLLQQFQRLSKSHDCIGWLNSLKE